MVDDLGKVQHSAISGSVGSFNHRRRSHSSPQDSLKGAFHPFQQESLLKFDVERCALVLVPILYYLCLLGEVTNTHMLAHTVVN